MAVFNMLFSSDERYEATTNHQGRTKRMQASWAVGFGKGRFVFFVGLFYMA